MTTARGRSGGEPAFVAVQMRSTHGGLLRLVANVEFVCTVVHGSMAHFVLIISPFGLDIELRKRAANANSRC